MKKLTFEIMGGVVLGLILCMGPILDGINQYVRSV
jgi:hypothetical protein